MKVTPFENHGFLEDVNFTWYPQNMHYNLYTKNKQLVKQHFVLWVSISLNNSVNDGFGFILTHFVFWVSIFWLTSCCGCRYFDLLCVVVVNIMALILFWLTLCCGCQYHWTISPFLPSPWLHQQKTEQTLPMILLHHL